MTEAIGYLAAACTTFALLPQAVHVWRKRSVGDVSLSMYVILVSGVVAWVVYGTLIHSLPLILANSVSFLFAGSVLAGKLVFMKRGAKA